MRILHCLDNSNIGGIQGLILNLHENSIHDHEFWAADGSMAPYMRSRGMLLWNSGPPTGRVYEVVVGHTVGGWSYQDTFRWARQRGAKTVEVMHSNATSPTPPGLVDAFVSLNRIADGMNPNMPNRSTIYGIVEAGKFTGGRGERVGRLSRLAGEKRPQDFVTIASRIPEAKFVMAGDGPMFSLLRSQAPPNLEMVGNVTNFPAFYGGLRLFVFPTQDECCCISVAMAQAAGIPVICQDIAPLRETTGGFAFFASSVEGFVETARYALFDPGGQALAEEYAQHGLDWAVRMFGVEETVGRWDVLINRLCS